MEDQVSDVASTGIMDEGNESDDDQLSSKSRTVHSMVEKKRRDRMTQFVSDLSTMIPMCGVMPRKLDKITVLRMTVQHMKAIKGSKVTSSSDAQQSTPLAREEMMKAILESSQCFLFVIACDRGKFLYVSESVNTFIHCEHSELIGQSIFEVLYAKDVETVKDQLKTSDATAREVFIDAKTMEPVHPGVVPKEELDIASSGAARSFFCRMKTRLQPEVVLKTEPDLLQDQTRKRRPVHNYVDLHCSGFLKTWASSKVNSDSGLSDLSEASSNLACLVAIAQKPARLTQQYVDSMGGVNMKPTQFYARLAVDYHFIFVEPTVTYVTGYLPQDVLSSSVFNYFLEEDCSQVRELLQMANKTSEKLVSPILTMKTVDSANICVRVVFSSFTNPLTRELEHLLLDITVVPSYTSSSAPAVSSLSQTIPLNTLSAHTSVDGSLQSESIAIGSDAEDDPNDEASQAILMSLLEADGGLGGETKDTNLSWLCNSSSKQT